MLIRIILFFTVITSATAQTQQSDTLVFATYRYSDNSRVKNIDPFAKYFGEVVGRPVKVKSYNSVHDLIAGMKNNETDIVFINTFGYLLLREQSKNYLIAASLQLPSGKRSTYQTAIVSSSNSSVKSLSDLASQKGKLSLLLVNPGSTSGNLIPRLKFAEMGLTEPEKFFTKVTYTKNHAATLTDIIQGKVEIGAFGNEEYHRALINDPTLPAKVNLLWESPPIPLGPVVFNKHLSLEISEKLTQTLLSLHQTNIDVLEAIKSGWTEAIPAEKFNKVDDRYYDAILTSNPDEGIKIIKAFAQ